MAGLEFTGTPPLRKKHRAKSWWIRWALATAVLILAVALQGGGNFASGAGGSPQTGSPAPDFTLKLFNGKSITLSSLKGKPVVVNFWHSG